MTVLAATFIQTIGELLGIENVQSIDDISPSLAAPWAREGPAWIFFGCIAFAALSFVFYLRWQLRGPRPARMLLAAVRALLLALLLLILAEPILVVQLVKKPKPLLWLLFDGTDSMGIEDELAEDERIRLETALGGKPASKSRVDAVKALLARSENPAPGLIAELASRYRLRAYAFDRADGVRAIDWNPETEREPGQPSTAGRRLADELTASGEVTALGHAFTDLARRPGAGNLSGVLVFSDFNHNSGLAPVAAAERLGVPVHTVGVGPTSAIDVSIGLQAPLFMKRAERSRILATLHQHGLDGESVRVVLRARRLGAVPRGEPESFVIEERSAKLDAASVGVEFTYTPESTGRFALVGEVEKLEGEIIDLNNHTEREVDIRDDFLRLTYVEYEPSWEWRFIKEVFHRDKLVGLRGFRTFLRSADPRERQTNDLFLPTLTPPRSEFFENDVIFLGDMPATTLTTRFCEVTREWVSRFGGGLVVIAGPRFGPGQLAETPLEDMLPVVLDPNARVREGEFELQLTAEADQFDFMQLGENPEEHAKAWRNLGKLPWYQPVSRPHPLATVLARHPSDTCVDGESAQPLIAIRRYGQGEVVFLGFSETWRLRRRYGALYYRQFWGQMIHRLGLSHALGAHKRFVVRSDRRRYQLDEPVRISVEAYDSNYQPLTEDKLPEKKLVAELVLPGAERGTRLLDLSQLREGIFETRVPAIVAGEYRLRVRDPITEESSEIEFNVERLSVERRSAVRNVHLARELAQRTGGRTYDLATAARFPVEVVPPERVETTIEVFPLWNTWLVFALVALLAILEWLARKLIHLP